MRPALQSTARCRLVCHHCSPAPAQPPPPLSPTSACAGYPRQQQVQPFSLLASSHSAAAPRAPLLSSSRPCSRSSHLPRWSSFCHLIPISPITTICGSASKLGLIYSTMGSSQRQENSLPTDCNEAEENSLRRELYPPVEPYSTGSLKVSEIHTLYWEKSGNPSGYPVLFLHGGPGAGTSSSNRRFFDPSFYLIVLLDQRGAGKSTPHACLEENTTWDLVEDIEKLRKHLDIQEWLVFGGSWGSTLSLTYTQSYPEHVTGIILRGIFLIRKKEIDWFYEGGASALFPDAWEAYRDLIPEDERGNFVAAYSKRLKSSNLAVELAASKAWTNWEMATSHLFPNEESLKRGEDYNFSVAFARIENHYFINKGFFPTDSFLLDNVDKIRHIPAVIIQGRYDVVCPIMSAWDLHKAWPEAKFKVVSNAGHSANEPGITAELVVATESFKELLGRK